MVGDAKLTKGIDEEDEYKEDEYKPVFDFNSPEDVLIEVVEDTISKEWPGLSIASTTVIAGKEGVTGAARYDQEYGSFLDYTIMGMVDNPGKPGWYVVVGITGEYFKGDGWTSDDDMHFAYKSIRPATEAEIAMA